MKTVTALAQRVIFNLREITAKQSAQEIQKQAVVAEPGKAEPEDEHDFETLAARFQKNRSVYLTLALCKQFGSFEQTMDEYLYSLQIEVDFALCLQDADEYEKQVAKKGAELLRSDAITVSLIEQTMLELLNSKKEESQEKEQGPAEAQMPDVQPGSNEVLPTTDKPGYEVENRLYRWSIPNRRYRLRGLIFIMKLTKSTKALCHIEGGAEYEELDGKTKTEQKGENSTFDCCIMCLCDKWGCTCFC